MSDQRQMYMAPQSYFTANDRFTAEIERLRRRVNDPLLGTAAREGARRELEQLEMRRREESLEGRAREAQRAREAGHVLSAAPAAQQACRGPFAVWNHRRTAELLRACPTHGAACSKRLAVDFTAA